MFRITLPDGSVREVAPGTTPADVAAAIGPGLAKAAIAARIDGDVRDITRPFDGDTNLALVKMKDEADALELVRHDLAHVMAEAVQHLFPGTQITYGPATDDGSVTSVCFSRMAGQWIGLGLVSRGRERIGEIAMAHDPLRGEDYEIEICNPVFYDPEGGRQRG